MPNHVKTVVKFKKLKKKDFDIILDMIARPLEDKRDDMFTPDHPDWIIDFNKIIPEPELESECDPECIVNKGSHIEADETRPWFDWYKWRNKYWYTKWGAYDGYTERGKTYLTFIFSTAWSLAEPVICKLALLGYEIDVKWADEDWGVNCGEMHYDVNSGWDYTLEHELPNPQSFARRLWDRY